MPEIKKQPIASAVPDFNADSAYAYVANQVAFGPRVPNSAAHKACGDYLASELKRFGAKVYQQEAILTAYDGTKLEARNIIGSFDPENSKRVLLFAHWDSRPYSDHDPDPSKHRTPLDGADDGGSGVGALLEIARQIGQKAPGIGIDIIFFDAEDYGTPEFVTDYTPDSWCLGTQFWAKIRMSLIIRRDTESYWIWWAARTPRFSRSNNPYVRQPRSSRWYGVRPAIWDMANISLTPQVEPSQTITNM